MRNIGKNFTINIINIILYIKDKFPELSYKELVQILHKVSKIIDQAKSDDVFIDLKEPILDTLTLTINSKLQPISKYINKPLVAIVLRKINPELIPNTKHVLINLYHKQNDFMYYGYLNNIKIFLSYLIYFGRI